jgi:hypothetical protein
VESRGLPSSEWVNGTPSGEVFWRRRQERESLNFNQEIIQPDRQSTRSSSFLRPGGQKFAQVKILL